MNVLALFNQAYENYMGPALKGYEKPLHTLYGLDKIECVIIAFLLHDKDRFISEKLLAGIVKYASESNGEHELYTLKKKGFIRMVRVVEEIAYYQLTPEAIEAFQNNEAFGIDCYLDHIAILKEHPFEHTYELKRFYYSLSHSANNTHLRDGVEELQIKSLPEDAQWVFWNVVHHFISHFGEPFKEDKKEKMADPRIPQEAEERHYDKYAEGLDLLSTAGLLEYVSTDSEKGVSEIGHILTSRVLTALFYGHDELIDYKSIAKMATLIKATNIEPCELFYAQKTQVEIDRLRVLLSPDGYQRARNILIRKKRKPAIISLLWGPPGTGKTEIVKQLARESGRDIILFDVSKTTGSLWGETEGLYKSLFRHYGYITAISTLPPILLMNEADAILSKRLQSIERSMDKAENNISNILLQEFEDLSGILLATTNLADNLDRAFERRFLFKTEIGNPDREARQKIWKSKAPELTDEEAALLAEQYTMTGAQVFNVATKCDLAELYYDGDRGLAFLQNLCEEELAAPQSSNRPRIGF